MNGKTFLTISREECLSVYKDILKNSDELWVSGEILARERKYGPAISISIISIEELIKAIIILYDSQGFEFRKVKGINTLLRNHGMRYVIAYLLYIVGGLISELESVGKRVIENPEEIMKFLEKAKEDPLKYYGKIKRHFLKKYVHLKKDKKWFSNADIVRQGGFYCDYDEELKNPIKITENEFEEIIRRLEIVRKTGKSFIKTIENGIESSKKLQLEWKANNYYDRLEEVLSLINKRKKKPFDLLKENFDGA